MFITNSSHSISLISSLEFSFSFIGSLLLGEPLLYKGCTHVNKTQKRNIIAQIYHSKDLSFIYCFITHKLIDLISHT